jgi:hypothetical protein
MPTKSNGSFLQKQKNVRPKNNPYTILKGPQIAKTTLKKQHKIGEFTHPNFKIYYKASVTKTE